jgi:hypothetical protein
MFAHYLNRQPMQRPTCPNIHPKQIMQPRGKQYAAL